IFTDAFIKSWSPWFYKQLVEPSEALKRKIVIYSYFFIMASVLVAFFVSIISKFLLPFFVSEEYYQAHEFILWIALGYMVRGVYQILFPYLVHIGRTSFLLVITTSAALVNLVLNYLLISSYGVIGAAYATLGAFIVSAVLIFWYQQKNYYMPWLLGVKFEK
ncbi:lipopolysaccharide biosynthesis protein, partial [Salinivibrio sp. PR919]|uniref:lipopolysaccharide biosynthesis protein n=1 Tax=Salinivibrio sp. PR919 TaxID=1909491 RepID=UPI0009CAEBCD